MSFIVDNWLKAFSDGKVIGTVLFDLRKAFGIVDHTIILEKMQDYHIEIVSMKWFKSYLTYRQQQVAIGNSMFQRLTTNMLYIWMVLCHKYFEDDVWLMTSGCELLKGTCW